MEFILTSYNPKELLLRSGGRKAATLARLQTDGFRIPEWFSIRKEAFSQFIRIHRLERPISELAETKPIGELGKALQELFRSKPLPKGAEEEMGGQLIRLHLMDGVVAVRLSDHLTLERRRENDDSLPSVHFGRGMASVAHAAKSCWAAAIEAYWRSHGEFSPERVLSSLLVQKAVTPVVSGVAYSRDPVQLTDRESILLKSVWGCGSGVLKRQEDAEACSWNRRTRNVEKRVAGNAPMLQLTEQGEIREQAVPAHLGNKPVLNDGQLKQVIGCVQTVENQLGAPQILEWGVVGSDLFVFDAKPIEGLPPDAYFDEKVRGKEVTVWSSEGVPKPVRGILLPFQLSIAREACEEIWRDPFTSMSSLAEAYEPSSLPLWGIVRGRLYCNITAWTARGLAVEASLKQSLQARSLKGWEASSSRTVQFSNSWAAAFELRDRARKRDLDQAFVEKFIQQHGMTSGKPASPEIGRATLLQLRGEVMPRLGTLTWRQFLQIGVPKPSWKMKWIAKAALTSPASVSPEKIDALLVSLFKAAQKSAQGIAENLLKLEVLDKAEDVFFLTLSELGDFLQGRGTSLDLRSIVRLRRAEWEEFETLGAPPESFVSTGIPSVTFSYSQLLSSGSESATHKRPTSSSVSSDSAAREVSPP